jgi:uncharacterized membrane protein
MPQVVIERHMINIDSSKIWKIACNVTEFSEFMDHVVSVDILESNESRDVARWVVLFNGSEMEWTESITFDNAARRTQFCQLEGDLAEWNGSFEILDLSDGILARYQIQFDVGVPALADELNILCEQAVRANCEQMLEKMELRSR